MKAMTEEEKLKRKKTITLIIVYAAITLFAFIVYYLTLPPINPQSEGFWVFLAFLVFIYLAPVGFTATRGIIEPRTKARKKATFFRSGAKIADFYVKPKKILLFALIPIGIMILCGLIGTELFWAKSYASLITVSEREFKDDMQETVNVDNVALMDSESAKILGQRTLGELAGVVSQYTLSENYTQINYKNTPQKVCNLEYDGFFKWAGNRKNGIPGYVLVDPVLNTSKFVEVSEPLIYAESAFFGEDLYRKLRFSYPTKIFGTARFEIDDNGNPFYIVPCMKPRIFLFGGTGDYFQPDERRKHDLCGDGRSVLGGYRFRRRPCLRKVQLVRRIIGRFYKQRYRQQGLQAHHRRLRLRHRRRRRMVLYGRNLGYGRQQ